jgi:peptide/nickel transport system permease protein
VDAVAQPQLTAHSAVATVRKESEYSIVWRQFRRNPGAVFGAVILVLLVLVALFAPLLAPYDPLKVNMRQGLLPPNAEYLMGTDEMGRDVLSRLLFGARISLQIGFISLAIAGSAGIVLGVIAGYYGGWIDNVVSRATDILMAFPDLLLALLVVAVLGPSLRNAMIAVGIAGIPSYVRLVRGMTLSVRDTDYVLGARAVGCYDRRIIWRYMLPNVLPPLIVMATLGIAGAILSAAGLSFIGLGAQRPTPEWGAMLSTGRDYMRSAWWITIFPGMAIMITVLSLNMMGDGLRDALDPRLRR